MAFKKEETLSLMKTVARANPKAEIAFSYGNENFSYRELNETLRGQLNEIAGNYSLYRENKNTLFALIEETIEDILPRNVLDRYSQFAEVKILKQGNQHVFKHRTGKIRAKQFITKVGLAGIYEVFKLGTENFTVQTSAIGGAAAIGLEEFLDGNVDFNELIAILMEGLDDLLYREIAYALMGSVNQLPVANRTQGNGFDEVSMDRLLATVSTYGDPSIYCTLEFASKLLPADIFISEKVRDEYNAKGYLASYKGRPVVILPQSFEDETNATKIIDPGYVWIFPSGSNKPVKVVFEGDTIVDEYVNADRSREIQVYKKVGVGVMMTNNIASYIDTELLGQMSNVVAS